MQNIYRKSKEVPQTGGIRVDFMFSGTEELCRELARWQDHHMVKSRVQAMRILLAGALQMPLFLAVPGGAECRNPRCRHVWVPRRNADGTPVHRHCPRCRMENALPDVAEWQEVRIVCVVCAAGDCTKCLKHVDSPDFRKRFQCICPACDGTGVRRVVEEAIGEVEPAVEPAAPIVIQPAAPRKLEERAGRHDQCFDDTPVHRLCPSVWISGGVRFTCSCPCHSEEE